MLNNWLRKYRENGYNIVERKQDRPTMNKKELKQKKNETIEEEFDKQKKRKEMLLVNFG